MSTPEQGAGLIRLDHISEALSYEQLIHCMRCGLCLPTCPTFSLTRLERATPRGRLAMMRAVAEGEMEITDGYIHDLNFCLGCLACQTACPAGVPYGELLEGARAEIEYVRRDQRPEWMKRLRSLLLARVLYGPTGLEGFTPLLRLYQSLGIARLNLGRLLPGPLGSWERMLPRVPQRSIHKTLGEILPAQGEKRGRVGLLSGCLENTLLSNLGVATARVLARNGFEVVLPPKQACCGALPGHMGEIEMARQQARQNIQAFEAAEVEIVISDAAGCSHQLKEYGRLLEGDPEFAARAARFSARAKDATEFLAGILPLREGLQPLNLRVAYDDPCHLIHGQGISAQPRQLLKSIPGIELLELPESSWCCGSAGTYNLTHTQEADTLLQRKMEHVRKVAPDVLATANTGCYIQLSKGVKEAGLNVEVMHVSELLARAYGES